MIAPCVSKRFCSKLVFLVFFLMTINVRGATTFHTGQAEQDPYRILGVSRSASLDTIKQKWRSLSKIHHPDKGGSAEKFAALSSAYEILSNPHTRKTYDQQSFRQSFQTQQQKQARSQKQKDAERRANMFKKQREAERRIRSRQAQIMQESLLRIRSVEELIDIGIMSKDNMFLNNFVGVFVGNKKQEKEADQEYMFPFPFSGNARNGLQWEDILFAAKFRYNQPTPLTRLFGVPATNSNTPYIIFGRSGDSVSNIHIFRPVGDLIDAQEHLENWVKELLKSRVTVVNHHHATVNLYLVRDQEKYLQESPEFLTTLRPGFSVSISSMIGDKIISIDRRVDMFPGSTGFDTTLFKGSESPIFKKQLPRPNPQSWFFQSPAILEEVIVRSPDMTLEISETTCFDLSLRCESWILMGSKPQERSTCQQQPEFMLAMCPASCGVCHRSRTSWVDRFLYTAKHAPMYQFPSWSRSGVRFGRYVVHDMHNIMTMRRTVGAVFFVVGVMLALNAFLMLRYLFGVGTRPTRPKHSRTDVVSVAAVSASFAFWGWLHFLSSNSALRRDWQHVLAFQVDAIISLLVLGAAVTLAMSVTSVYWTKFHATPRRTKVVNSVLGLMVFCAWGFLMGVTAIHMDPVRRKRWYHLWQMRKNIAFALFLSGLLLGQGISPIVRLLQRRPGFSLASVVNFGLVMTLKLLPLLDVHYVNDLHHVLQLRMSGAVPIGIAGLFLGFTVPLAWHLRQSKPPALDERCMSSLSPSKRKTA